MRAFLLLLVLALLLSLAGVVTEPDVSVATQFGYTTLFLGGVSFILWLVSKMEE